MALFVGEFEQQIDVKHRLPIPYPLRRRIDVKEDGEEFLLVLNPALHLWIYPDKYYQRLLETLGRSPLPDLEADHIDLLVAFTRIAVPDGQGRIVIPDATLRRSVLGEQVTLVGELDHIHVWPREQWDSRVEEGLPNYGETLKKARLRLQKQRAPAGAADG